MTATTSQYQLERNAEAAAAAVAAAKSSLPTVKSVPTGILKVHAIEARGMPKMDLIGDNDTYLKFSLDMPIQEAEQSLAHLKKDESLSAETAAARSGYFQSTQVADSHDPIWDESFVFASFVAGGPKQLYVEAWDKDDGNKDDLIGSVVIDLPTVLAAMEADDTTATSSLASEKRKAKYQRGPHEIMSYDCVRTLWIDLQNAKGQPAGQIHLVLHYTPQSAIERLSQKFNKTSDSVKQALQHKVMSFVTDMATSKLKNQLQAPKI